MILLIAVVAGLIAGLTRAAINRRSYMDSRYTDGLELKEGYGQFAVPPVRNGWLLLVAFAPQLLAFYIPMTSRLVSDVVAAISLTTSQLLLILFGWQNRRQRAFYLLTIGLLANFVAIASNGGLMPMSPTTLEKLVTPERAATWQAGKRIGLTKDRLLPEDETNFAILSDRLVVPKWTGYAIAYSIGDVMIALGAFVLLWDAGGGRYTDVMPV